MKFGKRTLLIIAAVIFAFSGTVGLAQSAAQKDMEFDKILINNRIKYNISIELSNKPSFFSYFKKPLVIEVDSGKSDSINLKRIKSFAVFHVKPSNSSLTAVESSEGIQIKRASQYLTFFNNKADLSSDGAYLKVAIADGDEVVGEFTVLARLNGKTLKVTIDSKDHNMRASSWITGLD